MKRLRKDAASAREALEERLDDARERWSERREELEDAAEEVSDRAERVKAAARGEDEGGSGLLGTVLALAVGAGITYLLTAEEAEPVRARMQEAASDLRRRAADRWEQYQRGTERAETGAPSVSSSEAPQAS
jgi:hypothetical protein